MGYPNIYFHYHEKSLELAEKNDISLRYNSNNFVINHNGKIHRINYDDLPIGDTNFERVYNYIKLYIRKVKLNKLLS